MEKQQHELNILSANSTVYFDYFTSTVDYLKQVIICVYHAMAYSLTAYFYLTIQILHQTNEAVSENRDRVQHLNDTIFYLKLQPPIFLNSIPKEQTNSSTEDNISPPRPAALLSNSVYPQLSVESDDDRDDDYEIFSRQRYKDEHSSGNCALSFYF